MATVLFMAQSKEKTGDVYVDRHRYERGDAVVIMPDGHQWSDAERNSPLFVVIDFPGVPPSALSFLLASDVGYGNAEAEKLDRVLRRRSITVNLDTLAHIVKDAKMDEIASLVYANRVVKEKLPDPSVIGKISPVKVFG